MTKRLPSIALALALTILVAGCTSDEPNEGTAPALSPAPSVSNPLGECARTTNIGVIYDEESQTAFADGLNLAAEQLNERASFGYEPVLTPVDVTSAPDVESATTELAGDSTISVIVSSARAEAAESSADVARGAGVALLMVGASSDETATGDGVFSLRMSQKGEVDALREVSKTQLGFKDPQVIGFPGLVDKKGEYLVAPGPGQDPGALMRGVADIADPKNLVGTSVYVFTDTGTIPDDVHVGVPWYTDAPEVVNEDFGAAYEAEYGEKPTIDAAYGYTSVLLVARAVEEACSNERAKVTKELSKTKDAASVFGSFSFTKDGEPQHPVWLLKIKNGTPTPPN